MPSVINQLLAIWLASLREATIFTFKFLGWIVRAILAVITFISNRRQNDPTATTPQADLFDKP